MWLIQAFGKGSSASRCDLKQNLLDGGCSSTGVEFPSSTLTIQEDTPLSDKASGTADDVTQIKPQKLHMVLRPGIWLPSRDNGHYFAFNDRKKNGCNFYIYFYIFLKVIDSIHCAISVAFWIFPHRWCQAVHPVCETGGGLSSGPLLSDGSFLLNEGWLGAPSRVGQWASRNHGPHYEQITHGVWSLCGQDRVPIHVQLPSAGRGKPLHGVGVDVVVLYLSRIWVGDFLIF